MPVKHRRPARPRPKSRAEFLRREKEVWQEMNATWARLPEAALLAPGACGPEWSVKDVMNHMAAWLEVALRVVPELRHGKKATAGHGTERFNALHYAEDRARSLAATRRRLNRARREVLALAQKVTEKDLINLEGRIGWWFKYTTYSHYGEHIYELTEFRAKQPALA